MKFSGLTIIVDEPKITWLNQSCSYNPWILKIESRINQFYLLNKTCFGRISMNGVVFNLKPCLKSWIMNIQLDVWVAYHMMCHVMWHHYFLTRYDDNAAWHSVTFVTWVTVSLPSSHRQRISDQNFFWESSIRKKPSILRSGI